MNYYLGIDIGSTTVKVAVLDDNRNMLFSDYQRHYANIQETLSSLLQKAYDLLGNIEIHPAVTGSGGVWLMGYANQELTFSQRKSRLEFSLTLLLNYDKRYYVK